MLEWKEAIVGQVSAIRDVGGGGSFAKWLASLLPDTAAPGLIPSIAKKSSEEKIVDVAEE